MTLETLKQIRACKLCQASRRTELAQIQTDLAYMDKAGNRQTEGYKAAKKLADALTKSYAEQAEEIARAEQSINHLPGLKHAIFRLRYMEGLSWTLVAQRTGYSEKQVFWIQRKTLEHEEKQTEQAENNA